jgi:hypothetical protein
MRKEEETKMNNNIFGGNNYQSNYSFNSRIASNVSNNK